MSINEQSHLGAIGHFTLGVSSEIFSVVITQPLDTFKTYLMNKRGLPRINRLWDGCTANCMGSFVQGGIPFLVNGVLVERMSKNGSLTFTEHLSLGFATGFISSLVIAPFDRIAKLQQSYHLNMLSAFKCSNKDTTGGLFKHVAPIGYRDAIVFGGYFSGRKMISAKCKEQIPNPKLRESLISLLVGSTAGFLSSPFDKISIRMAADAVGEYPSILQTSKKIIQEEGKKGLFQGASARVALLGVYMLALGFAENSIKPLLQA